MWMLRLVPANTALNFILFRKGAFVLSLLLVLASTTLFFTQGLNYGIDFRGGVMMELGAQKPIDLASLRAKLDKLNLGDVSVQYFGTTQNVLIRVEQQDAGEAIAAGVTENSVKAGGIGRTDAIIKKSLGSEYDYKRIEIVGPKISGELVRDGIVAVVVALCLMLIYIWLRFEWQFSLGAVVALVHDVVLTIGFFTITQLEFNLSIIAAILAIVGYSMNDTVVVYDRVRENLRKFKKMPIKELINLSINQTLSRTVLTSLTTLLVLFSLYFFGGQVIRGFTLAMIWGVVIGTYSSIFVASPILLFTGVKRDWEQAGKS